MTLNSSGVRDIGRVLVTGKDTVTSVLKKTLHVNTYFLTEEEKNRFDNLEVEIRFEGETDEFWSFVQNRSSQRRTRYAVRHRKKKRLHISLAQRQKTG